MKHSRELIIKSQLNGASLILLKQIKEQIGKDVELNELQFIEKGYILLDHSTEEKILILSGNTLIFSELESWLAEWGWYHANCHENPSRIALYPRAD